MKKKFMAITVSALLVIGALGGIAYATETVGKGELSEITVEVVGESTYLNDSTVDTVMEDEILEYIRKNKVTSIAVQSMGTETMNQMMGTVDYEDMNRMMRSTDFGDMNRMMEDIDFEDMNRMMESTGMGNMSGMMRNMGQMMNGMMGQGMGGMMGR